MTNNTQSLPTTKPIEINALLERADWGIPPKERHPPVRAGHHLRWNGHPDDGVRHPLHRRRVARSSQQLRPDTRLGLFGVAAGTACGGIVGDRIGRKKALIMSVLVFGAATLGFAFAHSIAALFVLRLVAGLGIGGALPNATTLTAEFTPARKRPLAVTLSIVFIPLGGVLAGAIASHVLVTGSWRTLFLISALSPLLLALLLMVVLPESPRYLIRQAKPSDQVVALLRRMGIPVEEGSAFYEQAEKEINTHSKLSEIFGPGRLHNTLCLWFAFFFTLVAIYLVFNWLPSMLTGHGVDIKTASQGLALYNFGGIFGALAYAWWINRSGSRIPLLVGAACGVITALLTMAVSIKSSDSHTLLLAALTSHGLFTNAVQTTMYALAANIYNTRVRATGVAAALATGRMGAIASAFLGSYVLAFSTNVYFALLAAGMGCAFVALFMLKKHIVATS